MVAMGKVISVIVSGFDFFLNFRLAIVPRNPILSVVGGIMKASRAALAFCCINFTTNAKPFVILMLSYFLVVIMMNCLYQFSVVHQGINN